MAFKSDQHRKYWFANLGVPAPVEPGEYRHQPMPPSFGWNEKPTRGDRIVDRIVDNESRIQQSGVSAEFANDQRTARDAFIEGDSQLTAEDKAKLLAYSGKWR